MLEIREHLDACPACDAEYRGLRATKQMLASLSMKAPRADFEAALVAQARQPVRGALSWPIAGVALSVPRLKPAAAAAALSLATVLLAAGALDNAARDTTAAGRVDAGLAAVTVAAPEVFPPFHDAHLTYLPMPADEPSVVRAAPLSWQPRGNGPIILSSYGGVSYGR
jgi:anti-sigma factor RsiW